jgi:hypothetical protein
MLRVLVQDLAPEYPEAGTGLAEGVSTGTPKRVAAKKTQGASV